MEASTTPLQAKHPECYNNEKVGADGAKVVNKFRRLQFFGLKNPEAVLNCIFLHVTLNQFVTSSCNLVGHCHHCGYVAPVFEQAVKTRHRKLGRSEKTIFNFLSAILF